MAVAWTMECLGLGCWVDRVVPNNLLLTSWNGFGSDGKPPSLAHFLGQELIVGSSRECRKQCLCLYTKHSEHVLETAGQLPNDLIPLK